MNAKKLLTYLDQLEREPNLKVNGNTYNLEQIKLAKKNYCRYRDGTWCITFKAKIIKKTGIYSHFGGVVF